MTKSAKKSDSLDKRYQSVYDDVSGIVDIARGHAARSVNAIMTAAYWLIGQYIVEFEQRGRERANYGEEIIKRLSVDLSARFGRGFSVSNLWQMRAFFLSWQKVQTLSGKSESQQKLQTPSGESENQQKLQTPSGKSSLSLLASYFPLPWSAYVRLIAVKNSNAREFYEIEALRGGWTIRQLDRQINSQFYERTALSKDKVAMLKKGQNVRETDTPLPEEAFKDPYVLEFLNLKDEYSESDLEEALVSHLETFLLELGNDFCFMGRQRRLRIGDAWYRMDLVFYHRRLRCIVIIDLKLGKFTHADAGQMHLYLNYALKNWVLEGENPPVGLILCVQKDEAVAQYALEGLPNKVMAAEYRTALPDEQLLASEIDYARKAIDASDLLSGDNLRSINGGKGLKDNSGGIS
ncbi:MAG: DUF1016 domain-containing protein [Rhodothermaceae bacterium]|nr:PDDEXK nuclease domain-containing protein [Bacteroidota bacterium]MXW15219.1 DUF1016 domain-containing protein [Rhodothermaceae bacterium]MDE2646789.1 PDDEXK nuclease domain-containing protein [Bacteroidota bacterium]MXX97461.1 DUF1016 domain-containing protein [Rhodothermaceae bacterium]MXZ58771.1 DUF1016 domain-containing protein [Rhodothermaceae bacterium]